MLILFQGHWANHFSRILAAQFFPHLYCFCLCEVVLQQSFPDLVNDPGIMHTLFVGNPHNQLHFFKCVVGTHQISSFRFLSHGFPDLYPCLSASLFQGLALFQGAACGRFLALQILFPGFGGCFCLFQGSCRLLEAHGLLQVHMPLILRGFSGCALLLSKLFLFHILGGEASEALSGLANSLGMPKESTETSLLVFFSFLLCCTSFFKVAAPFFKVFVCILFQGGCILFQGCCALGLFQGNFALVRRLGFIIRELYLFQGILHQWNIRAQSSWYKVTGHQYLPNLLT